MLHYNQKRDMVRRDVIRRDMIERDVIKRVNHPGVSRHPSLKRRGVSKKLPVLPEERCSRRERGGGSTVYHVTLHHVTLYHVTIHHVT